MHVFINFSLFFPTVHVSRSVLEKILKITTLALNAQQRDICATAEPKFPLLFVSHFSHTKPFVHGCHGTINTVMYSLGHINGICYGLPSLC